MVNLDKKNNLLTVTLKDLTKIIPFLAIFKNHSKFLFLSLVDITAVDRISFPSSRLNGFEVQRFQLVYIVLSHYFATKLIVECFIRDDENPFSIDCLFKAAPWLEREVWDMFGIFFENHSDLRRILTDYGFDGFPLRKDFPMSGYIEIRYDDTQKCLVFEPLELSQEYRIFDTLSPWVSVL
jgi:NADH:ubiquinone oxidoreductase subunit C